MKKERREKGASDLVAVCDEEEIAFSGRDLESVRLVDCVFRSLD